MSPYKLTRIEAPMRLALAFHEAFNEQDIEGMLALVAPDILVDDYAPAPDGTRYRGRDVLETFWKESFTRFPHMERKIEDAYGLGKRCIIHWRLLKGAEPSQRGIDVFTVQDDLIIDLRSYVKGG